MYWTCESLRQLTIYAMMIFSPWAFGTTQDWSIWTMNVTAYLLGALSVWSYTIRRLRRYRCLEWAGSAMLEQPRTRRCTWRSKTVTVTLAITTATLLAYCLTSAINARATFYPAESRFEYHSCIRWLPHSFDRRSTWSAFWIYLGFVCAFWSIRDWLLAKSGPEIWQVLPKRLRRLLWLLSLNGGLLASVCIIQRLAQSPKLLFLLKPEIHQTPITQFGPYAYGANAAQYLNLLWPLCLGCWWTLTAEGRPKQRYTHLLLLCAGMMSAAAIISASRGGALISASMVVVCALLLLRPLWFGPSVRSASKPIPQVTGKAAARGLMVFGLMVPILAFAVGRQDLQSRFAEIGDSIKARAQIYRVTSRMIEDSGVFGTGPGTYENVSELYRPAKAGFWPAQAHNDWLETRLTFGLPGSLLFPVALGLVLCRGFIPGGLPAGTGLMLLGWLGVLGCLVHSTFDFPFQVHSIAFLFAVSCAILFTISPRPSTAQGPPNSIRNFRRLDYY